MSAPINTVESSTISSADFKKSGDGSHRESSDNYHSIVVVINHKYRVITCHDQIQWILQKQTGHRHGQNRWDGLKYLRTRDGVIHSCRACVDRLDTKTLAILQSLPTIIGGDE